MNNKVIYKTILIIVTSISIGCNKIPYSENDYIGKYDSFSWEKDNDNNDVISINSDKTFIFSSENGNMKGNWEPILNRERTDTTTCFIRLIYPDNIVKEYEISTFWDVFHGCYIDYKLRIIEEITRDSNSQMFAKKMILKEFDRNKIDKSFSTLLFSDNGYLGSGILKINYDLKSNNGKYELRFDFEDILKKSSNYEYYFKFLEKDGISGKILNDSLYPPENFEVSKGDFQGRIELDTICEKHNITYTAINSFSFLYNMRFK